VIVTLLSDFGTADHYVAAMKGVVLSQDPRIVLVDISHEVPPHDVGTGAFLLASCHGDFPPGTVHLAVVDPGVGSARLPIAVRIGRQFFVGPDNGIFSLVMGAGSDWEVRRIEAVLPGTRSGGTTFHGRDLFAPAAAALALGWPFPSVGRMIEQPVLLPIPTNRELPGGEVEGRILHVDRFGNCVTSLRSADYPPESDKTLRLLVNSHHVQGVLPYYAAGSPGVPFAIRGSAGFIELSIRGGSAADTLRAIPGSIVVARRE
jgi:S-adenosyl-L-methionine hydrolase (adenosine-forming)